MYEQQVNKEVLYRAYGWVEFHYASYSEDGDLLDFGEREVAEVRIEYDELPVLRHTRCGVWVDMVDGREKWIAKTGRKRYAYPTKEEALISLQIRNRHRIHHLKAALAKAEAIRRYFEHERDKE